MRQSSWAMCRIALLLVLSYNAVAQLPNPETSPYQQASTFNKDYQPRYNPLYTNTQQTPQLQSPYDNPLLNPEYKTPDVGSGNAYNNYYDTNTNRQLNTNNYGGLSGYDTFNRGTSGVVSNSPGGGVGVGEYVDTYADEHNYCPEHWVSFRQSCYRFIRSPRRNWFDSKKICKAYNAELLNVDGIEKHTFILKQLIKQNQQQSRYWISAHQTGPNSWSNDDNSPFPVIEDSFAFDEYQPIENEDLHDNRFLVQHNNDNNFNNRYNPNQYVNTLSSGAQTTRNQNSLRGFIGSTQYGDNPYPKDRVVYAYSKKRDRWMFMPAQDLELNLFICESRQLYTPDNINIKLDDTRPYDYGLNVRDLEKVPRGPYILNQPNDIVFDTNKNRIINDVTLSCLAGGYPTPVYSWYREVYVNDSLEYMIIDPLQQDRYTLSGGNLIIHEPQQALDQGAYHCVAENKFGRIRSISVYLNFGFIMEFNQKRSAETGERNWGKSMFCDPPQHYPKVNYYWSRNFFPNFIEEDQRVFVSHDGALYFSFIETVDSANYSCTVQTQVSDSGRNGPFFPLRVLPNSNYQALIFANTFPKVSFQHD